jgi:cyclopropane fatty-acyl-phospholipid synthase-like methyltransferase
MSFIQSFISWTIVQPEVKKIFSRALEKAEINHSEMWIQDEREFYRMMALGVFEAGWISARLWELFVRWDWNPKNGLDDFICKLTWNQQAMDIINNHPANVAYDWLKRLRKRKPQDVWDHYDIPVEMYKNMLGSSMKYTAPEWNPELWDFDLDAHQKLAMEMICQRAELERSQPWEEQMKVLEVGFGYGTLASHAINNYGVHVTGLTVSDGQKDFAEDYMQYNEALENADLRNLDWKVIMQSNELKEQFEWKFDRIISIEMIEAVSTSDLPLFFEFLLHCLNDDGVLFIQAINSDRLYYTTEWFIDRYIFADGVVPQNTNLLSCAERSWFTQETHDRDIVTMAYDMALIEWQRRLADGYEALADELDYYYTDKHKPAFPFPNDPSFLGIFEYYLKSCAGSFRSWYNRDGQYKFYKNRSATTKNIMKPTVHEVEHILNTKQWWEIPR